MELTRYFVDEENERVIVTKEVPPSSELDFSPGAKFEYQGIVYVVLAPLDYQRLLVRDLSRGEVTQLGISAITETARPVSRPDESTPDLENIPDEDWRRAHKRFEIIRPVLEIGHDPFPGVSQYEGMKSRAAECGVSISSIKRWMKRYLKRRRISDLIVKKRSDIGRGRLNGEVEKIIVGVIRRCYLTRQNTSPAHIVREVEDACRRCGVEVPHPNTVRRRLQSIPPETAIRARRGAYEAQNRYAPTRKSYDEPQWPLAVVQIDHTSVDIVLVDEEFRQPIGRPWLTLAMDVYSRMVVGLYLSFDSPSVAAVGSCVATAILPKEHIIIERELNTDWPVWGKMGAIHVDNAKEFRSHTFTRACDEHGIKIHWRPVKQPHYGGHIERLLGSFAGEIHRLPGTTFSNPAQRGEYNSEKRAVMTLREFEDWLLTHILKEYHHRKHSGIGITPYEKYRDGMFGTGDSTGRGLPPRVMDEEKIRLDFMPSVERSVQRYGVAIDGILYYHDSIRRWVGAKEGGKPRKFIFRRDPRDIGTVWFYDPELQKYFPIPYRDNTHPPISLWELKQVKKRLQQQYQTRRHSEEALFRAREEMRKQVEMATKKSKAARRYVQRAAKKPPPPSGKIPTNTEDFYAGIDLSKIRAYPIDES